MYTIYIHTNIHNYLYLYREQVGISVIKAIDVLIIIVLKLFAEIRRFCDKVLFFC